MKGAAVRRVCVRRPGQETILKDANGAPREQCTCARATGGTNGSLPGNILCADNGAASVCPRTATPTYYNGSRFDPIETIGRDIRPWHRATICADPWVDAGPAPAGDADERGRRSHTPPACTASDRAALRSVPSVKPQRHVVLRKASSFMAQRIGFGTPDLESRAFVDPSRPCSSFGYTEMYG